MGLDNGIEIKMSKATEMLSLDSFYNVPYTGANFLEVCYWRKCWGLRNDIVRYLNNKYNTDQDTLEWKLDVADIKAIIEIVKSWRNKKKWNNESRSIWTYKEMKEHLIEDIENLTYLYSKMEHYNIPDVTFYDSY